MSKSTKNLTATALLLMALFTGHGAQTLPAETTAVVTVQTIN